MEERTRNQVSEGSTTKKNPYSKTIGLSRSKAPTTAEEKEKNRVTDFLSSVQSLGKDLGVLEIIQFQQKLERCQIVVLDEVSLVINFPGRRILH